jgi:hypothetical protein
VARKPGAFKYQTSWDATVEIASFVLAELAGGEPHAPSTRAAKKTVPAEAILTH